MERREQPAVPVGHRGECALIGAFLDRAAADGAALLPCDEPGAGKTVLLDAAAGAASAAKAWVLREEELHELSAVHRHALTVAVGVRNRPAPHRLLVSTATVAVLPQAAAPPSAWARQERSEPRHMTCEARAAPRSTEPAAINETISDWEVHDERGRTGHR